MTRVWVITHQHHEHVNVNGAVHGRCIVAGTGCFVFLARKLCMETNRPASTQCTLCNKRRYSSFTLTSAQSSAIHLGKHEHGQTGREQGVPEAELQVQRSGCDVMRTRDAAEHLP